MTSSNGNIFRVTGHLLNSPHRGEWREVLIFFYMCPNKRLSKLSWNWWFETPSRSLWRHCNVCLHQYAWYHDSTSKNLVEENILGWSSIAFLLLNHYAIKLVVGHFNRIQHTHSMQLTIAVCNLKEICETESPQIPHFSLIHTVFTHTKHMHQTFIAWTTYWTLDLHNHCVIIIYFDENYS